MGRKRKKRKSKVPDDALVIELEEGFEEMFLNAFEELQGRPIASEQVGLDKLSEPHRRSSPPAAREVSFELDLHGLRLEEALRKVEYFIDSKLLEYQGRNLILKVITGKGLHSGAGGAVLPRAVHDFISNKYAKVIKSIEDSPDDVKVHGVPIRGHFKVKFMP